MIGSHTQIAPFRWRHPLALLLVSALTFSAFTPAFASETPEPIRLSGPQRAKLHTGEVHVELQEGENNRGLVVGIIQAPVDDVIPLIARCWEYDNWREAIIDTGLERRESEEVVVCSGTAVVPFPARNRDGHFRVYNRQARVGGVDSFVSNFDYIEGSGSLEDMFGYWILHPYGPNDEHTLIKHVLNVDIGGFLPGFLVRWATRRILPDTIFGIREFLSKRDGKNLSSPEFWQSYRYE